ncbi:DUF1697 domain-containing protein [Candidatus Clostridium radicumherbarum]|uniref:DUF1697 domain-containing protein n=1 Tax=Candidatus Clostridium radicumherbarum TaxID=3381662 RepID=A0ABW8TPB3_9CLOT
MKYIAFLRGINVSGKNSIKMAALKAMFQTLGFNNVETYIQSGNVIFEFDACDTVSLEVKIKEEIDKTFGFHVETIVRTMEELINIISNNPLLVEANIEIDKLHVTLLLNKPEEAIESLNLKKEENEKYIIRGKEIYLYCPNGYGNTKLNNTILEKKLKVAATTRNWKTMNKLLEMMK